MKMRVIGLMAFLLAHSAMADQIHLICETDATFCDGAGADMDCYAKREMRELRLNEREGTMLYLQPSAVAPFGSDKWVEAKNVSFGDSEISGEVSGGIGLLGASMKLSIDRYSGVMTRSDWQGGGKWSCRAVANERAF